MIKYVMTASVLKLFAISPQTKGMYRFIGNTLDQRRRVQKGLNRYYVDRVKKVLELCEKHHCIKDGDTLLEIGTGWVHWESIVIRLFYDVEITMFDVWDDRYFSLFKRYFRQLEKIIDKELHLEPARSERVHTLLQAILNARSFDEVYALLGMRYIIDPGGTLQQFPDASFNLIYSCDVLEHINRDALPEFIQNFHRVLKPGGHSVHVIDLTDHLYYYDKGVSPKNYLRYSDRVWRLCFENIQYINRIQRPNWLSLFQKSGLELVEEESITADISTIRTGKAHENRFLPYDVTCDQFDLGTMNVDNAYKNLSRQDLQCVSLRIVHRKPD